MPFPVLILPLLISAAVTSEPPINVVGHAWAPFISPMGEPFRARTTADNTLALWFNQADRNRDGALTSDEMQADADRFFAKLDSNHDGGIDPEELVEYEWEVAPEIQVNSKWRRSRGEGSVETPPSAGNRRSANAGVDGYQLHALQGAARYALLNIPQPVAGADSDLNRTITLGEFRRAAMYRLQLLDSDRAGKLTLQKLTDLVPTRPKRGQRAKQRKGAADTRIGVPLPQND